MGLKSSYFAAMLFFRGIGFFFYDLLWRVALFLVRLGLLGKKAKIWYRKRLKAKKATPDRTNKPPKSILFFCSSLGEFERIQPIISLIAKKSDIVQEVCFFSDSGLDQVEFDESDNINHLFAPIDRRTDVEAFFSARDTALVVISSNAIWPNFLSYLISEKTPYIYAGSSFYGDAMLKRITHRLLSNFLKKASHISVIDTDTTSYLKSLGVAANVTVTGDPRIDRIINSSIDEEISIISNWKKDQKILICGSTHREDEILLKEIAETILHQNYKIIICPHDVSKIRIEDVQQQFPTAVLYSELDESSQAPICIIDQYGVLKKLYQSTDIAYVGGGFGRGVHNIMEPIIAHNIVFIGPQYHKFPEARYLKSNEGIIVVKDSTGIIEAMLSPEMNKIKKVTKEYISFQKGASEKIENLISTTGLY